MPKTLMAAGRLRKRKADRADGDSVLIQVRFEGDEARRFEAYKSKEFIRANAEAGRKLMLERITQVEAEAAA